MSRNQLQLSAVFYALAICFLGATSAQETSAQRAVQAESVVPAPDTEAQKVIDHVMRLRDKPYDHEDWKPENGPWADYLAEIYTDQLSRTDKLRFEEVLFEEDCRPVLDLQAKGFLRKFPFLESAHERTDVELAFRLTVAQSLPDSKFCYESRQLKRVIRFIRARGLDLLPIDYSNIHREDWASPTPKYSESATQSTLLRFGSGPEELNSEGASGARNDFPLKVRAANSLCAEILQLSHSRKFRNKRERLWVLLRLASRPDIVKFSNAQLFYFYRRAKLVGGFPSEITDKAIDLQYVLDANTQFHIDKHLRENKDHLASVDLILHCSIPLLTWSELLAVP